MNTEGDRQRFQMRSYCSIGFVFLLSLLITLFTPSNVSQSYLTESLQSEKLYDMLGKQFHIICVNKQTLYRSLQSADQPSQGSEQNVYHKSTSMFLIPTHKTLVVEMTEEIPLLKCRQYGYLIDEKLLGYDFTARISDENPAVRSVFEFKNYEGKSYTGGFYAEKVYENQFLEVSQDRSFYVLIMEALQPTAEDKKPQCLVSFSNKEQKNFSQNLTVSLALVSLVFGICLLGINTVAKVFAWRDLFLFCCFEVLVVTAVNHPSYVSLELLEHVYFGLVVFKVTDFYGHPICLVLLSWFLDSFSKNFHENVLFIISKGIITAACISIILREKKTTSTTEFCVFTVLLHFVSSEIVCLQMQWTSSAWTVIHTVNLAFGPLFLALLQGPSKQKEVMQLSSGEKMSDLSDTQIKYSPENIVAKEIEE